MIADSRKGLVSIGLVALSCIGFAEPAHAWGERGHHVICEAATRLVRNPELAHFLAGRGDLMGHVCNIPDIHWRNLGAVGKSGDSTHYLNPEKLDLKIADLPESFDKLRGIEAGKGTGSLDFGSLWWRADQFYRRALADAKKIPKPSGEKDPAYDDAVFAMITDMGLMGHFVGDASMPYHNTADHDGWAVGHGGIHAYYETDCVNALDLSLLAKVKSVAAKLNSKSEGDVVARMKRISVVSASEISKVQSLDKVFTRSSGRTKATRPPASESAKKFSPLIVTELARSARALADFWDEIYERAGKPDLSAYKNFRYPLAPDFVPPDYLAPGAP